MSLFSKNKLTPPPPPRRIRANYSSPLKYLFLLLLIAAAVILTGCPSPSEGDPPGSTTTGGGGGTPEGGEPGGGTKPGGTPGGGGGTPGSGAVRTLSFNLELSDPGGNPFALGNGPARTIITSDKGDVSIGTVSGKTYPVTVSNVPQAVGAITLTVKKYGFVDTTIGPIAVPASRNPATQSKTLAYANITTTVSGKVVTPARLADASKGSVITTARVWASTDTANKVPVDSTDGSYSLDVQHLGPGNFTITAEYTGGDGNYTTSDPQPVSPTAPTYTQDIALKYGYTTTVSGRIFFASSPAFGVTPVNGALVIIKVEGIEAGRDTTQNYGISPGRYRITVAHPGRLTVTASTTPASVTVAPPLPVTARSLSVTVPSTAGSLITGTTYPNADVTLSP